MTDRVLMGKITGAHGLRGEVRIASYAAAPEDIAAYGPLTDHSGAHSYKITALRASGNATIIARLDGISSRTEAEALRGLDFYVPRAALPDTEEDEFYHADLIGMKAFTPEGEEAGTVIAVQNFGAGDMLEIRRSGNSATQLVPFTQAQVPSIDLTARRVIVLPEAQDEPGSNEHLQMRGCG